MTPQHSSRGPAAMVFATAFVLDLAVAAYVAWRGAILQPYSDMFDWLARWFRLEDGGDWAAYLWPAHNSHHLLLTLGLLDLDIRWFGASGFALVAFAGLALAGSAILLAREAARAAPPELALPAGAFAAMLTLMPGSVLDVGTLINTTYVNALVFAVAALCWAERRPRLALVAAAIAPFGNAVALVVWPALLIDAVLRKAGWRRIALVAALGALVAGLYATAQDKAPPSAFDPLAAARAFLGFLGLPWTRAAPSLGWAMGLALLVPALAALALRRGLAVRLILFSLGAAALAALGRDQGEVPLRYAVFVTPLHVGLLILALPWLKGLRPAVLAAVAVAFLGQQALMAVKAVQANDRNRLIVDDFRHGARGPETAMVYVNPRHATELSARLRAEGLFQRELHLRRARAGAP